MPGPISESYDPDPPPDPDMWQCEPCPDCGTVSYATVYRPQTLCLSCLEDGARVELRCVPVYFINGKHPLKRKPN